jgi:hypothetical protein
MRGHAWTVAVVAHLTRSKRLGVAFDVAWQDAMAADPPEGGRPVASTLFDDEGEPHGAMSPETRAMVAFQRRILGAAYEDTVGPVLSGNGPALRHFRPEMLRDLDSSAPARKLRRAA